MAADRIPAYTRHRASGQAVTRVDGRDVYLGKWKSAESRRRYDALIGEWLAGGRRLPSDPDAILVMQVVNAYRKHAETYYASSDEPASIRQAMTPLLKLYARTPAIELGPLAIQAVQREMVQMGWCRSFINQQTGRIKRMIKWAARQELIPADVFHRLSIVGGLAKGRCDAPEPSDLATTLSNLTVYDREL